MAKKLIPIVIALVPSLVAFAVEWSRSSQACPSTQLIAAADRGVFICRDKPQTTSIPVCGGTPQNPLQPEVEVPITADLKFTCGSDGGKLRFLRRISSDNKIAYCALPCSIPVASSSSSTSSVPSSSSSSIPSSSSASSSSSGATFVAISISPAQITEGSTTAVTVSFLRTGNITNAITVSLGYSGTAAANADYTGALSSIIIPANSLAAQFQLAITNDTAAESTEVAYVKIISLNNGASISGPDTKQFNILDNDKQNCVVGNWTACSKTCGTGNQTRTVTTAPINGGTACPALSQHCNTQACCENEGWISISAKLSNSSQDLKVECDNDDNEVTECGYAGNCGVWQSKLKRDHYCSATWHVPHGSCGGGPQTGILKAKCECKN